MEREGERYIQVRKSWEQEIGKLYENQRRETRMLDVKQLGGKL